MILDPKIISTIGSYKIISLKKYLPSLEQSENYANSGLLDNPMGVAPAGGAPARAQPARAPVVRQPQSQGFTAFSGEEKIEKGLTFSQLDTIILWHSTLEN
jgi:hypothetical protein